MAYNSPCTQQRALKMINYSFHLHAAGHQLKKYYNYTRGLEKMLLLATATSNSSKSVKLQMIQIYSISLKESIM